MKHVKQNSALTDIVNEARQRQQRLDADTVLILGFLSITSIVVAIVFFTIDDLSSLVKVPFAVFFLGISVTGFLQAIRVYNFKRI